MTVLPRLTDSPVRVPGVLAAAVCAWAFVLVGTVPAQRLQLLPIPGRGAPRSAGGQARMVHVTDRRLEQRLLKARELLGQKQVQAAVRLLQSVIDNDEDVFFQEPRSDGSENPESPYRSLKVAAVEALTGAGTAGRKAYELEFGSAAKRLLDAARVQGRADLLGEAARRYLFSAAGRQAAYALGNRSLDRGEALMAAMRYEQLRKLGASEFEPVLSIRTALAWARLGQLPRAARVLASLSTVQKAELGLRAGPLAEALGSRTPDEVTAALAKLAQSGSTGGGDLDGAGGQWVAWRGRHDRVAMAAPAVPGARPSWAFSTFQRELDDPERQDRLAEVLGELAALEGTERARDGLLLPAVDPLVIGDVAIFRSLFDIKAVHLPTGKHLWDSITVDPAFERVLDGNVPSYSVAGRTMRQSLTELFLSQRAWYDRTIGSLSTDGRHIYAIDWVGVLGLQVFSPARGGRLGPEPDTTASWVPRDHNRLLAFELASEGMLVWELGGPRTSDDEVLDGTYFLGAPLPLGGLLYCLGERDGEIRLLALHPDGPDHLEPDARGGAATEASRRRHPAVAWSQGLAQPEYNILTHPGRRLAGLSPSYLDGVLVCPTEAGIVVGVDVARRQLLWSYSYSPTHRRLGYSRQQAMRRVLMTNRIAQLSRNDGWFDPVPILSGKSVILTPRDSDSLHCLDLESGDLRWSRPRGQAHFVAAVTGDAVVVVERSRIQAYRLEDGKSAWSMPTSIPRPTGVGVQVDGLYHLPVESRETAGNGSSQAARRGAIVTIDLGTGRLLARTELADGRVVGHLVGAGGRLVGLSHNELVAFETDQDLQDRIASRLARDRQDATALALRGRRRLHRGEYEPAVADLAASVRSQADPGVRRLLVQALLDGLRFDYARYADHARNLEGLLKHPDEQLAFRRLRANGLARSGDVLAAFEEYLKLRPEPSATPATGIDPALNGVSDPKRKQLESIDEDLSVRRVQWIAARLAEVERRADAEQEAVLAGKRKELLTAAGGSPEALWQLVTLFDGRDVADTARQSLVSKLPARTPAVARERLLLGLRASSDPKVAGRATAKLLELWVGQQKPEAVASLRRELETGRFSSVEWAPGVSGASTVAAWKNDPARAEFVADVPGWKTGDITADTTVNEERRTSVNTYPIPFYGRRPLPWRGWSFRLDNRRQYVIGLDGNGRERWRLTTVGDLAVPGSEARVPYAFEGNYVRATGHLLLVVLGNRFAVVDGLGDQQHPHVLWRRNLFEDKSGAQSRIARLPGVMGAGPRWFKMTDSTGRPIGHVGRLDDRRLTYQVGTAIEAADPLTGRVLWRRGGLPRGCRIYGNDRYVCVEPDDRNEVLVLDASDGAAVATRTLPPADELIRRVGRSVISRRSDESNQTVAAYDLLTGKTTFSMPLKGTLRPVLVGDDRIALLETTGRLRIIEVATGRVTADSTLKLDPKLLPQSFVVLPLDGQDLVMVNQPTVTRVRGTSTRAVTVHGFAWAVPSPSGDRGKPVTKTRWGPVAIDHQALELDQPRHLPVLTFASRVYHPVQNVLQQRSRTEYRVMVLDVRTGKVVHKETSTLPVSAMRAVASRTAQRVTLEFYRSTISLDFTDP